MVSKQSFDSISNVMMDWVMFNPNNDMWVYCTLSFLFKINGEIEPVLYQEVFRTNMGTSQFFWYFLFAFFTIYYTIIEVKSIWNDKDREKGQEGGD